MHATILPSWQSTGGERRALPVPGCISSSRCFVLGVVTFCWTPVSLFFDYAMSPSSRLRLAMLVPKVSLILSSRYQVMYASRVVPEILRTLVWD